jgi:tRNA(Ile)-lysidine synthase
MRAISYRKTTTNNQQLNSIEDSPSNANHRPSITLLRPLLEVTRNEIEAYLEDANQPWVNDPSNSNPAYLRTRVRQFLASLKTPEETIYHLASTAAHHQQASSYINQQTDKAFSQATTLHYPGIFTLDMTVFETFHDYIQQQILLRFFTTLTPQAQPPRATSIKQLQHALHNKENGHTLGGIQILFEKGAFWIFREQHSLTDSYSLPKKISPEKYIYWDARVAIKPQASDKDHCIHALTKDGLQQWEDAPKNIPKRALQTLPALFHNEKFIRILP